MNHNERIALGEMGKEWLIDEVLRLRADADLLADAVIRHAVERLPWGGSGYIGSDWAVLYDQPRSEGRLVHKSTLLAALLPTPPTAPWDGGKVIDLMAALKASLAANKKEPTP